MSKQGCRPHGNFKTSYSDLEGFETARKAERNKSVTSIGRDLRDRVSFPFTFTFIFVDESEGHQCVSCCNFRF